MEHEVPEIAALLEWFEHDHLPEHLHDPASLLWAVAHDMADQYPHGGAELEAGLRKLLEAKDCLVRVAVYYHQTGRRPRQPRFPASSCADAAEDQDHAEREPAAEDQPGRDRCDE